jgi:hypothetical protein
MRDRPCQRCAGSTGSYWTSAIARRFTIASYRLSRPGVAYEMARCMIIAWTRFRTSPRFSARRRLSPYPSTGTRSRPGSGSPCPVTTRRWPPRTGLSTSVSSSGCTRPMSRRGGSTTANGCGVRTVSAGSPRGTLRRTSLRPSTRCPVACSPGGRRGRASVCSGTPRRSSTPTGGRSWCTPCRRSRRHAVADLRDADVGAADHARTLRARTARRQTVRAAAGDRVADGLPARHGSLGPAGAPAAGRFRTAARAHRGHRAGGT